MTEARPKRRFRFGLRTLLFVVTLAAVASWAYFVAWPWWQNRHEEMQFLAVARQIQVGMTPHEATKLLGNRGRNQAAAYTYRSNGTFAWMAFDFPRAIYFIAFELDNGPGNNPGDFKNPDEFKARTVRAYRFSQVPAGSKWRQENAFRYEEYSYLRDCVVIVNDDNRKGIPKRKDSFGIEYELIYSDPPAKSIQ